MRILCTRGLTCCFCSRDTKAPKCLSSYKTQKVFTFFLSFPSDFVCERSGYNILSTCGNACVQVCVIVFECACWCVHAGSACLWNFFFRVHINITVLIHGRLKIWKLFRSKNKMIKGEGGRERESKGV